MKRLKQIAENIDILPLFYKDKEHQEKGNYKINTIVPGEIWMIENFLSDEQCKALVNGSEEVGFTVALVNTGVNTTGILDKEYRDSLRVMIDDIPSAQFLFESMKKHIPLTCNGAVVSGLNERLRFLKYHPGGKFMPHIDGCFPRNKYEESMITVQFYLNDVEEGGATRFFDSEHSFENFENDVYDGFPKKGMVAIFRQQGWVHEGSVVKKGVKYTIRTELMYKFITDVKDFKPEKCGVCQATSRINKLTSCGHLFVVCDCPQFYCKKKLDGIPCRYCFKKMVSEN